jgi:hypothetical protein
VKSRHVCTGGGWRTSGRTSGEARAACSRSICFAPGGVSSAVLRGYLGVGIA